MRYNILLPSVGGVLSIDQWDSDSCMEQSYPKRCYKHNVHNVYMFLIHVHVHTTSTYS